MTPTAPAPPDAAVLDCRGRALEAGPGAGVVMGILNVTPDSFSDGGRYTTVQAALERAGQMADQGAAIVDVGGESTRPGSAAVGLDQELERVVPVVEAVVRELPHLLVSVDTSKGAVAREALRAGAHLVNDVTGLRRDVGTAVAAAEYRAPLVVMHSLEGVGGTAPDGAYRDVVEDVARDLEAASSKAEALGVPQVVVDPGFGFGKTVEQNVRLIGRLDRLVEAGRPVLVGVSRKSTIGAILGSASRPSPPDERLFGSLGLAALAVVRGAAILRVHDVRETVEVVAVVRAALEAGAEVAS